MLRHYEITGLISQKHIRQNPCSEISYLNLVVVLKFLVDQAEKHRVGYFLCVELISKQSWTWIGTANADFFDRSQNLKNVRILVSVQLGERIDELRKMLRRLDFHSFSRKNTIEVAFRCSGVEKDFAF